MLFKQPRPLHMIPALAAIALLGSAGHPAHAQGVVASTNVDLVSAPANVQTGQYSSNPLPNQDVIAFTEQQNLVLTAPLAVDISTPGTYSTPLSPGIIPTGTTVNSFFFYADPSAKGSTTFTGSITFNTDILGLEVKTASLDGTDSTLGLATMGTTYPNGGSRGLELATDSITLDSGRRTLTWSLTAGANVDSIRVLTAVPEPAMALPMGLMLLTGLMFWRRRPARIGQSV